MNLGVCEKNPCFFHLPLNSPHPNPLPNPESLPRRLNRQLRMLPAREYHHDMESNRSRTSINLLLSRFSTWRICSREQAKSECDWLVISSVFVASQSCKFGFFSVRANKFTWWKTGLSHALKFISAIYKHL